ncbi:MAG: carboxypeptidase-like regulatory domain-containing protein [Acidobacteriales bacterium]|nr:carboxypeptidase-like regulatory domain-containing protein [Terriglobales bacterium]
MILTARFGAAQAALGYQFYDSAGALIGSRITAGIVSLPETGSYHANATLPAGAVGVYWNDTATLATAIEDLRDAIGIANDPGSGAYAITVTVTDGTHPLEGARVRITEGGINLYATTNATGNAVFALDAGTYDAAVSKSGYQFAPESRTVTGNEAGTLVSALEMAVRTVPAAPSSPNLTTVFIDAYDINGSPVEGEVITFSIFNLPTATPEETMLTGGAKTATTDAQGRASIELESNVTYKAVNTLLFGPNGLFFTPTGDTYNLADA